MCIRKTILVLAVAVVSAATAAITEAQTLQLPKNDATLSIGWFGAEYPQFERYNRWHQSLFSGAAGGHYWTDHLKSEVEAAWLSRVNVESYGTQDVAGGIAYVRSTYRLQDTRVSLSQLYQFGENAWVHPYIGVGADVDYLRTLEERPVQLATLVTPGRTPTSVTVAALTENGTTVRVRPIIKGGFKMYASDRVFATTEWKAGFGSGVQHVLWKVGVGFDF